MNKNKLIAIVGPTASGKTGVGVRLAKKIGGLPAVAQRQLMQAGEIISADSRQIFRGLDIGSGKEGQSEADNNQDTRYKKQANLNNQFNKSQIERLSQSIRWTEGVPQWLIDVAEPGERFTLFDWLDQARIIINDIFDRGKTPIVVGGTGLYVSALVEGFQLEAKSEKRKVKNDSLKLKIYSRQELNEMTLEELEEICLGLKTYHLGLDLRNKRRLIRAIERAQGGEEMEKVKPGFESLIIGLDVPREELYERIDKRADERFNQGMLEETRSLLLCHPELTQQSHPELAEGSVSDSGPSEPLGSCLRRNDNKNNRDDTSKIDQKMAEWLVGLGLDYKYMTEYLLELQELGSWYKVLGEEHTEKYKKMVEKFKFAEHDYARRQLTWWRKKNISWAGSFEEVEALAGEFISK